MRGFVERDARDAGNLFTKRDKSDITSTTTQEHEKKGMPMYTMSWHLILTLC
jgi:hypothetical protein